MQVQKDVELEEVEVEVAVEVAVEVVVEVAVEVQNKILFIYFITF
jgi:hypothetical protein